MKKTLLETAFTTSMHTVSVIWEKAPIVLLIFFYSLLVIAQKEWSEAFSTSPERLYHNNHLQVEKLGKGSICVHLNQPAFYSRTNSSIPTKH